MKFGEDFSDLRRNQGWMMSREGRSGGLRMERKEQDWEGICVAGGNCSMDQGC
jgi:hypothetical protein